MQTSTKVQESITGKLADLVRDHDWSQTPLGPPETWPQSLRTAVQILLSSRYAMWMGWGPELTFLYNDAYRPTLGMKHPWALGSRADQVWAEIWSDIGPRIRTVLSTGEATWDEGLQLFLERSGFREETYHTFSYSPLQDDSGRVNGMLCVVTEETERVISEGRMATLRDLAAALAGSNSEREVMGAVVEQLGKNARDLPFSLTYLYNADGEAVLSASTGLPPAHPAAVPVLAAGVSHPWPAGALSGTDPEAVLVDLDDASSFPVCVRDQAPDRAVIVPIRQQGHERPAGFLVAGLNPCRRYDEGYAGFVQLVAGQIAAGVANARAYDEERRRAEALAELDRAKTAFFSNVSHEFRTPLTLMLGPIEDMLARREGTSDAAERELLAVVHRSGLRLQRLVNTLLDFSRIEAGRAQASYVSIDLAAYTAELASSFRSAMERAGLHFEVDCRPLSQAVFVDREMWEKIVLNLLSNAFKYTLHGSVSVELGESGGNAVLRVRDTGPGIPAAELPRLFERFHRVEGTHGRTHEGTGIGLALVQELVKLHGGTVSVESVVGEGAIFTVRLPFGAGHLPPERLGADRNVSSTALHADAYVEEALRWLPESDSPEGVPESTVPVPSAAAAAGVGRSRVLLADDNADMRDYVRRLLSERYQVTAVSNGEEALRSALAEPPELVLTDVMMPGLDGFGLLAALRRNERTKTLPVIMLSARAGEESRLEGLAAGADDYLVKPFTARELLARVEAHLSMNRMRREADQARRLSEVRLGLALDHSGLLAWQWDPSGDTVHTVGDMKRIFGAVLNSSTAGLSVVHPDDVEAHKAKIRRVGEHGGTFVSEFRIRRVDTGEIAWLEERAAGITDENGRVVVVVGVVADVTERRNAEEEIRRYNQELLKANRELEEFAYVSSHDLQEPLRMVNAYTQLLLRRFGGDDPTAEEYARFIREGVTRMENLIRDLLTYSRTIQREDQPVGVADLNAALADALSVLEGRIQEIDAEVVVTASMPTVRGDVRQFTHVFQNLLSNSLKYRRTDRRTVVRVSAVRDGGEWIIAVGDNGIGFEQAYAERIFGLFKRLHREEYPGTGLGLAICKRIVERYGGRMWAEGMPDEGATIFWALPVV